MFAPPRHPWNERYGLAAAPEPAPKAKTSRAAKAAKAAAAPGARAMKTAEAAPVAAPNPTSVHFYSVHRDFGIQPSPPPIPPQFFTAAQDLAEPEGPQAIPAQTTGKGALAARARAEAETSAPD
jgi:hypothetical protein